MYAHTRPLAQVISRPGPLQDALSALLTTIPAIEFVYSTPGTEAMLGTGIEAADRPLLVVLDGGIPNEGVSQVLQQTAFMRRKQAKVVCLALAEDAAQSLALKAAGADAVVLMGSLARELVTAVGLMVRLLEE